MIGRRTYFQAAGLAMVGPAVFLTATVVLAPFAWVVAQTFFEKDSGTLGLGNLAWLVGPAFLPAFWNSALISVGAVLIEVLVAVPLALLLDRPLAARAVLRSLVTIPWAIPTVAVATGFLWPRRPSGSPMGW